MSLRLLYADHFGVERFLVVGLSAGGPYAVACGALLPLRVAGVGVVNGVTDMVWVPRTGSRYATCVYSWTSPPSRSRRTTRTCRLGPGSGSGRNGVAWPSERGSVAFIESG
jgi:pimeloyl-ACP methyl ester carboxylesterase